MYHIALIFENGGFVVVNVEIVGRRKDRHDRRKPGRLGLAIHPVPGDSNWRLTNEKRTSDGPCILSRRLLHSRPVDEVSICYHLFIKDGGRKEI